MSEYETRDSSGGYFGEVLQQRFNRRDMLKGALLAGASIPFVSFAGGNAQTGRGALTFTGIRGSAADEVIVPAGYRSQVLVRWGDSLSASVPSLDTSKLLSGGALTSQAAQQQTQQFGTNCDAIQFFQLNSGKRSAQGVLCVNNEYIDNSLVFPRGRPGFGSDPDKGREYIASYPAMVSFSQAAHGISTVEINRDRQGWRYRRESKYNRRITATTPFEIRGPVRGAAWMRTQADPEGIRALGTFGNCAGGRTPWGSYLSAEENIQDYFGGFKVLSESRNADKPSEHKRVIEAHRRWRLWPDLSPYGWDALDTRFDLAREPHEPFRCGWIVEIDPLNAHSTPVKRTALGRFAHEAASPIVARSGQVAVYMGDDDKFEYIYKFVSAKHFDAKHPAANTHLLDEGTLYVARFDADGSGQWLPLVYDPNGPLNEASGFRNQAEVLIQARLAGDVLGATTMDRPEDVEPNPLTGHVYIVCTRNESRTSEPKQGTYGQRQLDTGPNAPNSRGNNLWGHIIELSEDHDDHTGLKFHWEVFLMAGDPAGGLIAHASDLKPGAVNNRDTYFAGATDANSLSAIGSPDNIGFDNAGNLWIVTDGDQPHKTNNGCFAVATTGTDRGRLKQFMSGPKGAEICGCTFTPDNETFFLSIQHPGEGGTLEKPESHWPDGVGKDGRPQQPRSSVIAITKEGGGVVGS